MFSPHGSTGLSKLSDYHSARCRECIILPILQKPLIFERDKNFPGGLPVLCQQYHQPAVVSQAFAMETKPLSKGK